MRVLILGGSGFIGGNLIPGLLRDSDVEIVVFDIKEPDITRYGSRVSFIQGTLSMDCDMQSLVTGMDVIIHLVSSSIPGTEKSASRELADNVAPSMRLFEAAAQAGVKHMLFMSSGGTVYGIGTGEPNHETDPARPIGTYGLQKLMIEDSLRFIGRTTPMTYQIIRLSNPYGPGQNPHGPLGLVTKLVYQAIHHEQIHIYGDGSVTRDYIYIDDAVQGILDILHRGAKNETYNLGTGIGASVGGVLSSIERVIPEPVDVLYEAGRKVDVPVSVLDIARFRQISTIKSFVTLEDGIRRTAEFFRTHA